MKERVKVFTFVSGAGAMMIEPELEDHINEWLDATHGRLVSVTQSESERQGQGHHVTVSVWYVPEDESE